MSKRPPRADERARTMSTDVRRVSERRVQDDGTEVAPTSMVAGIMYFLAAVHATSGREAPTRSDVKRRADGMFAALAQQVPDYSIV